MMNCPYIKNTCDWLLGLKTALVKQKSLGYGLALAVVVTFLFGMAMFIVDPNIHSFWDGVWYAWVTLTHVGYGDVVPTSFVGRLLACLLILFGLAVLALLTATFSAMLIGRDVSEVAREESEILVELKRLHERLDQLEARIQQNSKN